MLEDTYPHTRVHTHAPFEKDSRRVTKTNSSTEIRQLNLWICSLYAKVDFKISKSLEIVATIYRIPISEAIRTYPV